MLSPSLNSLKLPDPWQHQAVDHLRAGADVIVSAPTGAGKTYIFELLHESRSIVGQSVYTVPTRALANDKYAEWQERKWDVGIATGDVSENIHAPVLVATLETQIERLLRGDGPAVLVIDEYQMIADAGRGPSYEGAIALAGPETRLLLLSGSVANPDDVAAWMRGLGRKVEVVSTKERPVPLDEVPAETLPVRHAKNFHGWWARLAVSVLAADLAPLLIFSPRRKDAESIARSLANELPQGDSMSLTAEQKAVCGKELSLLLEKRIAYHHSGLSYAARAGVIEPLAKAGQLRVVVATMGLAAGINFSVRSVHVAATKYHNGTAEQALDPDELLQMFGRAGRRGLDDCGYVITSRESPTLHDARPARLARSDVLAWSMFLRVMKHATLRNTDPFTAATHFAARLFAKVPPPLGLEEQTAPMTSAASAWHSNEGRAAFGLEAMEDQVFNSNGRWETRHQGREQTVPLGDVWQATEERQAPALSIAPFVASLGHGFARVYRQGKSYGLEVALGPPLADFPDCFKPTRALRKLLKLSNGVEDVSLDEFHHKHQLKVARKLAPDITQPAGPQPEPEELPAFVECVQREGLLMARYDLSSVPVRAYQDKASHFILNPLQRTIPRASATDIFIGDGDVEQPARHAPRPGSAIHAWRSLGLIDSSGAPTQRGEIVSFFQHGDGLAIAAALEDETYRVEDLALHMANLRAGFRFELPGFSASERLGAICRQVYGFVNHHGYLNNGLPIDYGEGATEVIEALIHHEKRTSLDFHRGYAEGDVSRAYIEWLSLLRHVTHAPAHPWVRWQALQAECVHVLRRHSKAMRHLFHLELPPLTTKQRHGKPRHVVLK